MHYTRCHDASLIFPVSGKQSYCTRISRSSSYLCFCSVESYKDDHSCAFSCLDRKNSVPVVPLYWNKSVVCVILFLTLCLWRLAYASAESNNLNAMPSPYFDDHPSILLSSSLNHTDGPVNTPRKKRTVPSRPTSRRSLGKFEPDLKTMTAELARFVCYRLPDPCARAAYLRQHVRHPLCPHLPLLYLLPHVNESRNLSQFSYSLEPCEGSLPSLHFSGSDSFFRPWLIPSVSCERNLRLLQDLITERLESELIVLHELLKRSFCKKRDDLDYNITGEFRCGECRTTYVDWLCATEFPLYYPMENIERKWEFIPTKLTQSGWTPGNVIVPSLEMSAVPTEKSVSLNVSSSSSVQSSSRLRPIVRRRKSSHLNFNLILLKPCSSWCTQVETSCPYLNPQDLTANGGEPAFLCDEGHYHHSSRYGDFYRLKDQCTTECCFTLADLSSLSHQGSEQLNLTAEEHEDQSSMDEFNCHLSLTARCSQSVFGPVPTSAVLNNTLSGLDSANVSTAVNSSPSSCPSRTSAIRRLYLLTLSHLILHMIQSVLWSFHHPSPLISFSSSL